MEDIELFGRNVFNMRQIIFFNHIRLLVVMFLFDDRFLPPLADVSMGAEFRGVFLPQKRVANKNYFLCLARVVTGNCTRAPDLPIDTVRNAGFARKS